MRKGLQATLLILSLIPLIFGLTGIIIGVERFMPPEHIVPGLDSQFRFVSSWYLGLAIIIWWMVPNVERHGALIRIISAAMFLGGLARAWSWIEVGEPQGRQIAAMVLELLLPLLAIWQARVARDHAAAHPLQNQQR